MSNIREEMEKRNARYAQFCLKCYQIDHILESETVKIGDSPPYLKHVGCGGVISVLAKWGITHEKLDALTPVEVIQLSLAVRQSLAAQRENERRELNMLAASITNAKSTKQAEEARSRPCCPTCQSTNVRPISTGKRLVSVFTLGLGSSTLGKSYECLNCKYKW